MLPYIICFFSSCLACYLAQNKLKHGKKGMFIFLSTISILIPAVLAGCRDYTVGTDVMVYGNNIFNSALQSDKISYFFEANKFNSIEPLYLLLNFMLSRITNNPHWLYFIVSFITVLFTYLGLYNYRDKISMWLGFLVFYTLFYNETLNIMRQSTAIAILFWGLQYVFKKDLKKYLYVIVFAFLFHNTAIVGISLYYIYNMLYKKNKLINQAIIIVCTVLVMIFYSQLIDIFIQIGLFPDKFVRYQNGGNIVFELNPFLIRLPIILLIVLFYKTYNKRNIDGTFLFTILIIEIILSQLRSVSSSIYRISVYFAYLKMLAYPYLCKTLKDKNMKVITSLILISYLILVWLYQSIYIGNNDTYPYTSEILGIM